MRGISDGTKGHTGQPGSGSMDLRSVHETLLPGTQDLIHDRANAFRFLTEPEATRR